MHFVPLASVVNRLTTFIILILFSYLSLIEKSPAEDAGSKGKPRQIFAHYMGCFPGGCGPIYYEQYSSDSESKGFRHDSTNNREALAGGRFKAWPLYPVGKQMDGVAAADLEIRRALRDGINGFDIDAWAGGDVCRNTLDTLFTAAEAGKYPFQITICIDPWSLGDPNGQASGYASAIKYLLDKHGKSPNLARRDGKPLIFTYQGQGLGAGNPAVKPLNSQEGWESLVAAYDKLQKDVGQPLYFFFDISELGLGLPESNGVILPAAKYFKDHFGAIGGFVDIDPPFNDSKFMEQLADVIHSGSAEWSPSIWYQYNNWAGHQSTEIQETEMLRNNWERAIKQNAGLLQFGTWNDYGEHTTLAPTTASYYGIGDLNRYYADWWKTGKEPVLPDDRLYVTYKAAAPGSPNYPFTHSGSNAPGKIEVVSILTAAGTITLPGREVDGKPIKYDAPKGLSVQTFPLTKGAVVVELSRNGKVEQHLEGHETVTDRPFRAENIIQCVSSVDQKYWDQDFPGQPFLKQSFYGDDDNDGLPNWFEMYWWGKWGDYTTDTVADPKADPNKVGKTNLQSYLDQTDPTRKAASYPVGYVWDYDSALKVGRLDQNTADSEGTPVWSYRYRDRAAMYMKAGDPIDLTKGWEWMTYFDGPVRVFSQGSVGGGAMMNLWMAEKAGDPNTLMIVPLRGREIALAWLSPINGTVTASFTFSWPAFNPDNVCAASLETSNHEKLWSKDYPSDPSLKAETDKDITVPNIKVTKGESIYLVLRGNGGLFLKWYKITVTQ